MFDLEKIRFSVDRRTYERAVGLYESGKVTKFRADPYGYEATVIGTEPYRVYVSNRHLDEGNCSCYLGKQDELCKHMVAVAIYAAADGKPLTADARSADFEVHCGSERRELTVAEVKAIRAAITAGLRCIGPYNGPSRIWFAYQDKLREGCNRLSAVVRDLPIGVASAKCLINLLTRLDNKLMGGVDDSDGTVGGFMFDVVSVLVDYAKTEPKCLKTFAPLVEKRTCFEWDEPLVRLWDEYRAE